MTGFGFGPQPDVGANDDVELAGIPLYVVPGSYQVTEAPGYAEKLSIGETKYADLSFAVSAHSIANFVRGYGVRRYSDISQTDQQSGNYLETFNVDCRSTPAILGPLPFAQTVPGIVATPIWGGEFVSGGVRYFVLVAGTKVWRSTDLATWTDTGLTLAGTPLQGAVGVYGGKLLFGYGAAAVAQWTSNLTSLSNVLIDTTSTPIYVYAFTADHANAYIAGGPAVTDRHIVYSSSDQTAGSYNYETASRFVCGSLDNAITSLAPGGGIVTVFVGKTTELGAIAGTTAIYRILAPYDSYLPTNSVGMRWWLGSSFDEQRGPVILILPRDRAIWAYEPSSENAGRAQNISPWGEEARRPPTIRGRIAAVQGAARWLYYAVTNGASHTWIIARDARTGANHPIIDLGTNVCTMLAISSLGVTNPRLLVGTGAGLTEFILPLDGDMPLDDAASRYAASGTLDLPDIDIGLPDEDKVAYSVRIIADALVPAAQVITVQARFDGGAYGTIGIADISPSEEIEFHPPTLTKRVGLRLQLNTTDPTRTPQLLGVVLRASVNPKLYRQWVFQARFPHGAKRTYDPTNPYVDVANLWFFRARGIPVTFRDRWRDYYDVRIYRMGEKEPVINAPERVPERVLDFVLLATRAVPIGPAAGSTDWVLDESGLGATTTLAP